ncbi:MAG: 1,4-dihydroxy-2-naphthoate polyprenyltransferase, partial [Candidatus Hydrogenedentes bacterium]|nr:1,4-dihydroxy-2-naphthoate polyprenyltransferase [Candidatus Hydrogenedentota bacterium]
MSRRTRTRKLSRKPAACEGGTPRIPITGPEYTRNIESSPTMHPLKIWLLAARPKTLAAGLTPVLIGTAMAAAAGSFHLASALCAALGALLIQIGTNFANDYFDFVKGTDTEERVGPKRATQAGLVSPKTMLIATIIVFALSFVPGAYLIVRGGWPFLAIGVVSVICGILYTGGPYPLGYLGLGDLFVLVFFGPVAVGGTYYVQALTLPTDVLVAGLMPGLFSTAILTVNNLRDADTDVRTGKKTLAVRFGKPFARLEYLFCVIVAGVVLPLYLCIHSGGHWPALTSLAAMALAVPLLRNVFLSQ